jgi:protein-tyrosine phosphatase
MGRLGGSEPGGATSLADRHVHCDGVFNLRDLGGYRAGGGRRTRWRTLFRADGLHRAPPSEAALRALGWRTVIDLRTIAERDAGAYSCEGVDVVHLPVLRQTWDAMRQGPERSERRLASPTTTSLRTMS